MRGDRLKRRFEVPNRPKLTYAYAAFASLLATIAAERVCCADDMPSKLTAARTGTMKKAIRKSDRETQETITESKMFDRLTP
jgi:hypothetical protein